jgi:hypothetical protein
VVDVGRDDGTPARHLVAHELGGDELLQAGAERLPRVLVLQTGHRSVIFPRGDVLHLRRDDALAGIVHLGNASAPAPRLAVQIEAQLGELGVGEPFPPVLGRRTVQAFGIGARVDPLSPQRRQTAPDVDLRRRVGVRARGVVDQDRRVAPALGDLAHRHAQRPDVNLAGIRQRLDRRVVDVRARS